MKTGKCIPSTVRIIVADIILYCSANAATFYVSSSASASDDNAGTIDSPWKSILKANQVLQAGDTVYIRAGTYSGSSASIKPVNSGESDGKRIVYCGFGGETVLIKSAKDGIYLSQKSFITVNGISFDSLTRFLRIYDGHHNTISYCRFNQCATANEWAGAAITHDNGNGSTHNRVHHCSFSRWAYGAFAEHRGGLLDLGNDQEPGDSSSYNLIENNIFRYGGHHTLGVYSRYNIIRNNYFHNEKWDFDGFRGVITEGPESGNCLYEGNRFGFCGCHGLALRSPGNILRSNLFYHQVGEGGIQIVWEEGAYDGSYNHIYNNDFYHNGFNGQDPYSGFEGGVFFTNWGEEQGPFGNVITNNIFFDNKNGPVSYDAAIRIPSQTIANNWDQNSVDPGFVNIQVTTVDDTSLPDLRLKPASPCIDAGHPLTTITSPAGNGTRFQVADAAFFSDGWGIENVQGDEIQLEGTTVRARITAVDYDSNRITVNTSLSWTQGQGISLAFEGEKHDLGAYEMNANGAVRYKVTGCHAPVALLNNYPDPFNATTTITYEIPPYAFSDQGGDGFTSLIIFDRLGREIATLINNANKTGRHAVEWNGTNSMGQSVGNGMYFCKLTSGCGLARVRKMTLMR